MKGRLFCKPLVALILALLAGTALAQSILEFDIWMQKIDQHSQDVLRNISKKDAAAGIENAREIARLYRLMEGFYEARANSEDAAIASYVGRDQAEGVQRYLSQNNFDAAHDLASEIARDCRNCHDVHKPIRSSRSAP